MPRSDPIAFSYAQWVLHARKDEHDRHFMHLAFERMRKLMPEMEPSRDPWYQQPAGRTP